MWEGRSESWIYIGVLHKDNKGFRSRCGSVGLKDWCIKVSQIGLVTKYKFMSDEKSILCPLTKNI